MGKKLDALLGRGFKTAKFKTLVNLAISRLAVLKNQRQVRSSQARSDVIQLLNLDEHDRALLRVEVVIKEQNMLDAFVTLENYCHLLIERVSLIANEKECPDELKEALSTLIFASSRCGEFPELREIRNIITAKYGKEFASRAIELRNHCGVSPKVIQKFSTRQPSLENKMKLLKVIASEKGITLKLQEESSVTTEVEVNQRQNLPKYEDEVQKENLPSYEDEVHRLTEALERDDKFSETMKTRKQYKDAVSAAQAAFESAAFAAAAARAAMELSREKSRDSNHDDPNSPLQKIQPGEYSSSDSETNERGKNQNKAEQLVRSASASSSDSDEGTFKENKLSPNQKPEVSAYDTSDDEIRSESEDEIKIEEGRMPWHTEQRVLYKSDDEGMIEKGISKDSQVGFSGKSGFARSGLTDKKDLPDLFTSRIKDSPLRSNDYLHKNVYESGNEGQSIPMIRESKQSFYSEEEVSAPRVNKGSKPFSVRTKRA